MKNSINTDDLVGAVGLKSNIKAESFKTSVTIGQTLQLDLDGMSEAPDKEWIKEHMSLSDVYLIFESSEGNYMIQGLRKRNFEDIITTLAGVKAEDPRHFKNFVRREGSVLRMSSKGDKPRPQLIDVVVKEHTFWNDGQLQYSEPHLRFYSKVYPEMDIWSLMPVCELVGNTIETEKYLTKEVKE